MNRPIFQKFFAPAIFVMNRFRYLGKFLLISFFFILPLSFLALFFLTSANHDISVAEKERIGVEYIASVRGFLQNIQQHRALVSMYLGGNVSLAAKLADKQQEILRNEKVVDIMDRKYGEILDSSEEWRNIKLQWKQVQEESLHGTTDESFQMHTVLAERVVLFFSFVGDSSNLILDPNLDSYYLMDVVVHGIPYTSERLGQLRGSGLTVIPKKELLVSDQQLFLSLSSVAKSSLQEMNRGLGVSYRNNPLLSEKILPETTKIINEVNVFLNFIDKNFINATTLTMSSSEYYLISTYSIDEVFRLYDIVSPSLDALLKERIDMLTFQKNSIFTLIGLMFLFVIYFFMGFYFSIRNMINSLKQATTKMTHGEIIEDIKFEARDELSEVVTLFNSVAKALTSSNTELNAGIEKQRLIEAESQRKNEELERFNKLMVGRELKMIELKEEIEGLKKV